MVAQQIKGARLDPELEVDLHFSAPFGVALRALRKTLGWTQLQLAVEVHRDHTQVSRWETGSLRPSPDDVAWLESVLPVGDGELALLRNAWQRSCDAPSSGELVPSVEDLLVSVDAVRTLRHLGQPRLAHELAARDARVVLGRARTTSTTEVELQGLLAVASELLLEEVKGALDFATSGQVRAGLLVLNGREHRLVSAALGDRLARVRFGLAREAVQYSVGDAFAAHREALELFSELGTDEPEWLAETIRAVAINGGLLEDHGSVSRAWERFESVAGELGEDLRWFVLEGFIRGFASGDPDRAYEILDSAYQALAGFDQMSPVRWVQLVRSESRLVMAVSGSVAGGDVQTRVEKALALSQSLGLPKYVNELDEVLHTGT